MAARGIKMTKKLKMTTHFTKFETNEKKEPNANQGKVLLDSILVGGGSRKSGLCGGMYHCLGGLIGPPMGPGGRYQAPGHC